MKYCTVCDSFPRDQEATSCRLCGGPLVGAADDDFDADELGLDPEEEYDA